LITKEKISQMQLEKEKLKKKNFTVKRADLTINPLTY